MSYTTIAAKDVLAGDEIYTGGDKELPTVFHWSRVREVKSFVTKGYVEIITCSGVSTVKHSQEAVAVRR